MSTMNRIHNSRNPYQGNYKRVLCVCSAGLLRSPTIALVLSQPPYEYNTRACGIHDYALVPIDDVLVSWADEIVFADIPLFEELSKKMDISGIDVVVLSIPDRYPYRDKELINLIKKQYDKATNDCVHGRESTRNQD